MIYELTDTSKAAGLFDGWQETLIYSCLQKVMGKIYVTDPECPKSAMAYVGCFAFYAGEPDKEIVRNKPDGFTILVPQSKAWETCIEECFPKAKKVTRFAIKKDTKFDKELLRSMVAKLPGGYELKEIDEKIYDLCPADPATRDFVSSFETKEKYLDLGRGMVIMKSGRIVAGASSYTRYREGIEIEVDTIEEERRKGLATIASAALILRCLDEGLYPSWDAQNINSVRLAEKLGYEFDHEYTAYEVSRENDEEAMEKALFPMPDSIKKLIAGKEYTTDDVGMSGSKIMIFDDCVLKILDNRLYDEESSVQVLNWLKDRIPVPRVLAFEKNNDYQYLLMSRIPGEMSCSEYYLEHPKELLSLLAKALKMLWSVDVSGCPIERDIDAQLKEARYRVENGLVDIDDAEPATYGKDGFENPKALLKWLEENKPAYEPVLSHGDFCLPNIFLKDGDISGFIDLGGAGIGDKWEDIALCYRSLKHNFDGTYGGKVYPDFDPDMLFDALEIEPDWEKIKFFILLDELF